MVGDAFVVDLCRALASSRFRGFRGLRGSGFRGLGFRAPQCRDSLGFIKALGSGGLGV